MHVSFWGPKFKISAVACPPDTATQPTLQLQPPICLGKNMSSSSKDLWIRYENDDGDWEPAFLLPKCPPEVVMVSEQL